MRGDDGDLNNVVRVASQPLTADQFQGLMVVARIERAVFNAIRANPVFPLACLERPGLAVEMERARKWWEDNVYEGPP
jgi:hypothetical protein